MQSLRPERHRCTRGAQFADSLLEQEVDSTQCTGKGLFLGLLLLRQSLVLGLSIVLGIRRLHGLCHILDLLGRGLHLTFLYRMGHAHQSLLFLTLGWHYRLPPA